MRGVQSGVEVYDGAQAERSAGRKELSSEEIRLILDTAASMKEIASRDIKKVPALRGKTVINLFYEPSTRTRTSFEIAGKWLSADVINYLDLRRAAWRRGRA